MNPRGNVVDQFNAERFFGYCVTARAVNRTGERRLRLVVGCDNLGGWNDPGRWDLWASGIQRQPDLIVSWRQTEIGEKQNLGVY
jgi:hypothetical protein